MGPKGIPYIVTHDGRTIRFPDPSIKTNDTVRINLRNGEVMDFYKFEKGSQIMINGGNNIGRIGTLIRSEKHDGSYDIIHVKDSNGETFSTRMTNVFVVGNSKPEVSTLKSHNRLSIMNERKLRTKRKHVEIVEEEEENETSSK